MTCAGSPPECRDEPSLAAYRTWKQTEPVGLRVLSQYHSPLERSRSASVCRRVRPPPRHVVMLSCDSYPLCLYEKQVIVGWVAGEGGKGREERQKVYEKLRWIDGVYGNTEKGVFRHEGVGAPA